jgi:hypothetical protein
MIRTAAAKIAWVGRTASMVFGLALVLALLFGVASMALAGTGVGGVFNLGQKNTVDRVTQLVGTTAGAMLKVDNNGSGTALDLRVGDPTADPAAKTVAPMKVDSGAVVNNLNADKIDGKDSTAFVPTATYVSTQTIAAPTAPNNTAKSVTVNCNRGLHDMVISGGVELDISSTDTIYQSRPQADPAFAQGWEVGWRSNSTANVKGATVYALCAPMQ